MNLKWTEALADLYADGALSEELKATVDATALSDARLAHDLHTLGVIRETLAHLPAPAFDLETEQRIRAKIEAQAGEMETTSPLPSGIQYHLPFAG